MAALANTIRRLRFDRGEMTPAELAAKVCVTRQTNNAIEQNKYAPSLDTAFRTAEALGVPIGDAFSCR